MSEVLSQSQIDALLMGITSGQVNVEEVEEQSREAKKIKPYDFRSPKRFTKEQLKTLSSIYENYSRILASYFTSLLRFFAQLEVVSIEEQRYHEFNNALPDAVLIASGEVSDTSDTGSDSVFLLELPRNLSFLLIDRLMGGGGEFSDIDRDYTEIELALLGNIFSKMVPLMSDAWVNHYEIETRFDQIETNARLVQSIAPDEIVLIVVMDLVIRNINSTLTLCIPAVFLESIMKQLTTRTWNKIKRTDTVQSESRKELIMTSLKESALELRGVLGHAQVTTKDILELKVGDVLKLPKSVDAMIDVNVGETTWFKGNLGTKKMKKAIRIERVL